MQRLQGNHTAEKVEAIFQQQGLPTNAVVGEKAATDFIVLLADTPADFLGRMIAVVRGAAEAGTIWPDAYVFLHVRLGQEDMISLSTTQRLTTPELGAQIQQLVQMDQLAYSRSDVSPKKVAQLEGQVGFGIQTILQEYGMPTYTMVGVPAAQAFFGLMNHQSNHVLDTVLPDLQQVLEQGEGDPRVFATLFDRMQMNQGDAQTYGTQLVCGKQAQLVAWKIYSPKHLDHRRAAYGLEPERCYLDEQLHHAQPCNNLALKKE